MSFRINYGPMYPLGNPGEPKGISKENKKLNCFKNILKQELEKNDIKISSHAQKRLSQRNIILNQKDLEALKKGMNQAHEKGSKESLLLYKDMAFVTSVKNRTIITAMDQNSTSENVFTNIDSAVIIK